MVLVSDNLLLDLDKPVLPNKPFNLLSVSKQVLIHELLVLSTF